MELSLRIFLVNVLVVFSSIYAPVLGETGCPPSEDIYPCKCFSNPTPILICQNIVSGIILEGVFENSNRYTYQEVHIQNSTFPSISHEIFENTAVKELYIENSTLITLFDDSPRSDKLQKLHLENVLLRGLFRNLTNFSNLKTFYADNVPINLLSLSFTKYLPKSLKQITLRRTKTRGIGDLNGFENLEKLVIASNNLRNISRAAFPTPFNVRFIYLDDNKLTSLPDGLFSDMPNLQLLSLKNNNLTSIPETVFGQRDYSIPYLKLDGNPLSCDCLLVWIVNDKPEILGGTCKTPKRLTGRDLRTLRPADFNCAK